MFAVIWLFLAIMAGWKWSGLIFGRPRAFLRRINSENFSPDLTPVPSLFFQSAAAVWLGILPLTWITYLLAAAVSLLLPQAFHPLTIANPIIMITLFFYLTLPYIKTGLKRLKMSADKYGIYDSENSSSWPALVRSLQKSEGQFYTFSFLCFLLFSIWLMTMVFHQSGTLLRAGYSVFSDFAPHTALVSSFARGANWPTQYPHFAGDGISYHFMFYFLCGNLDFLGLPTDWAINLPSILGLLTFCVLLGTLAVCLTGRRMTFLLVPSLLLLRSSLAIFTFVADLIRLYGPSYRAWPWILRQMSAQSTFIGNTPRDEWGLWGINVYANQRHLLPGFSLALIVLFIFLPDLTNNLQPGRNWTNNILKRQGWMPDRPGDIRRMVATIIVCLLMPYWHGSALIGLLLILAILAIFARNRLSFALAAAAALTGAFLQSAFFTGQAASVVQPQILLGFIAEDKSLFGIARYLLEMSGLAIPLLLLALVFPGRLRKIMLGSFIVPLIFALTVSLTPDVTVNHKYIIMTLAMGNIYIADIILRLWSGKKVAQRKKLSHIAGRLLACLIAILLMATGVQELIIVRNINRNHVTADLASPLVTWIENNTAPDAIFITAPHHYHSFFLAGRYSWLGHSYYAWSAGHDTGGRMEDQQWLLRGGDGDMDKIIAYIDNNNLDYLMIDDQLRQHPQFELDENFFQHHFVQVASIAGSDNISIIDLKQRIN